MSRFSRINPNDESGVTLVIVAILIVALFGMLTLVVDVGGLLVKKRSMVAAADAASLAAAESCAVGHLSPLHPGGPNAGLPEDVADQYAMKNATGLNSSVANIVPGETVGCETASAGRVTVSYTAPQTIYFGQVVGTGSSTNVTAKATAEWVPGGSSNPMPFAISDGAFSGTNCTLPNVPVGTDCYIWEDNGGGGASGYGGSVFGTLDLNRWNIGTGSSECNGANNDKGGNVQYAFDGGYTGTPALSPLNYPDATYVCLLNGNNQPFYSPPADTGLENPENFNRILSFPVISDVEPYTDRFNVIGFVKMKLIQVLKPNDGGGGAASGDCTIKISPAVSSVDLDWPAATGGVTVDPNTSCPALSANTDISTISSIQGCGNGPGSSCAGSYTFDGNHVVTFSPATRNNDVTLKFHWQTYGVCGVPPGGQLNNSGHCIVLRWEGIQLGNAPGGANFGVVNTRLCDATISKSCKSIP